MGDVISIGREQSDAEDALDKVSRWPTETIFSAT